MASNRFKTTITKKDGTTASGYIENDRGYYDDGTALSAGDSIIDAQNKVWTKGGGSSSSPTDSVESYLAQYGVSLPSGSSGGGGSSSGSYKTTGVARPDRTGYLRSAKELADLYDINYDMDTIREIYDGATEAKYALLSKELEQAENDFYTNNANANATLLDTLRKATSSAIATGASRGLAGAEQLGLMMEAQQGLVEESTNLAQERANMADEIAKEKAKNIIDALEYSNDLKTTLGGFSTNDYASDTQYDVGLLDWAAQMKNVEALFEQIAAEKDTNAAAQKLQAALAILDDTRLRDEGKANRDSNEKIAAAEAAAQKAYYDYMMKTAGSGGGYGNYSGSGYYSDNTTGNTYDEIWNSGNYNQMVKYFIEHYGMDYEAAEKRAQSDKEFMLNVKMNGYNNRTNNNQNNQSDTPKTLKEMFDGKSTTNFSQEVQNAAKEIFKTGINSPVGRNKKYDEATIEVKKAYDTLYNGGVQYRPHNKK